MHRQAEHFGGQHVAHRGAALAHRIVLVGLLAVQRDRIIDGGRHAFGLEAGRDLVAATAGDADGVLRPHRGQAGRHRRDGDDIGELFGIVAGGAVARGDLVGENLELLDQDRGLDRIEAGRHADTDVVVFIAALPVHAQAQQRFGEFVVVGEHRAAVAVAAERLGREKAGGGGVTEGAERAAFIGATEALRGVVEHEQIGGLDDLRDRVVIRRQAEQIDRNDGLRLETEALGGRERCGKPLGVDVERVGLDVDEDRRGADQRRHFGGGAEGERGAEHRVARADALRHQRQHQRVGAAGAGDDVARAGEFRELGLEGLHFRPEDELAMVKHALNGHVDGVAETAALCRNVDEWNRRQIGVLVHCKPRERLN